MKTSHLIGIAAAFVVILLVIFAWRQSALEDQIASLQVALENRTETARPRAAYSPDTAPAAIASSDYAIGKAEPFTSPDAFTAMREQVMDLERVLNGQADLIEDLLTDKARVAEEKRRASYRAWGPEQATGEPDTMTAGDHRTAWAPASADGGVEWIEATFENPADLASIVVRQTMNPGGITKVVAVTDGGVEIPIWAGEDPSKDQDLADTPFNVPGGINARRVKVYVDTSKKAGWEEIDAIQAVGRDGSKQWANSVNASSTYASPRGRTLGGRLQLDSSSEYNSFLMLENLGGDNGIILLDETTRKAGK